MSLTGLDMPNETGKPLELGGLPDRPLEGTEWLMVISSFGIAILFGSGLGRMASSPVLGWLPFVLFALAGFPLIPYLLALAGARFRTGPLARDSIHLPLSPDERWQLLNRGPVRFLGIGPLLTAAAVSYVISAAATSNGDPKRLGMALIFGALTATAIELFITLGLTVPLRVILLGIPAGTAVLFVMPLAFYLFMLTGGVKGLTEQKERLLPLLRSMESLYANPAPALGAGLCLYLIFRQLRQLATEYRLTSFRLGTENEYLQSDAFLAAIGRMAAVRSSGDVTPVDLWGRLLRRGSAPVHEPAFDLLGPHAEELHARMELVTFQRMTRNVTGQLLWRPLLALFPVAFLLVIFYVSEGPETFRNILPYLISLLGGLSIGGATGTAFLSGDFSSNRVAGGLQSAIAGRGDPKLQPWAWMPGVNDRLFSGTIHYVARLSLYAVPAGSALAGSFSAVAILLTGSSVRWPLWAAMVLGGLGAAMALLTFCIRTPIRTLSVYRFSDRMNGFAGVTRSVVIWAGVTALIFTTAGTAAWTVYRIASLLGLKVVGIIAVVYLFIPLVLLSIAAVLATFVWFERWRYHHGQRDLEARPPLLGLLSGSAAVRAGKR